MADQIRIRELTETSVIDDESYLAIDYENETHKVSVGNFNANANATAKRYAEQAAASATDASGYASAAAATSAEVDLKVTAAQGYATDASGYATAASGHAADALGYSNAASGYANAADASAGYASADASAADASATLAQSWAVGGTNSRSGEDTNNARYWSDVAAAAAGGGVTSFNGRGGAVTPQSGDYTAAMVGAAAASDVYTKSEVYTKNEVYAKSEVYPKADVDTAVAAAAAAGVTSFKNRVGAVTPASGDYTALMVNATDTYGLLGNAGATSDGQALFDDIANRVMNQLVSNSTFQNTIANYVAKSMITELATYTNAKESVLDGREKNPSISGSLAEQITGKAPTSHASSATTYGKGTASDYGHVKLSNSYTSSGGAAADGVGASSKAVADAYSSLNTNLTTNYATKTDLSNTLDKHVVVGAQPAGGGSVTFTLTSSIGLLFGARGSNYFAYIITVWDATARTLFTSGSSLPTIAHTSGSDTFTVTNTSTNAMPMIFITRP